MTRIFKYKDAVDEIKKIYASKEYEQCRAQKSKDEKAKRLLDVLERVTVQLNYALLLMKEFEDVLQQKDSKIKIPRPECVRKIEVNSNYIYVIGYSDRQINIRRSRKDPLKVALYELDPKSLYYLIDKAMRLEKLKKISLLIGAAIILIEHGLPSMALQILERALSHTSDSKLKAVIREFMFFALLEIIEGLYADDKGREARKLWEGVKKEFKDTKGFKELKEPPIEWEGKRDPGTKSDPDSQRTLEEAKKKYDDLVKKFAQKSREFWGKARNMSGEERKKARAELNKLREEYNRAKKNYEDLKKKFGGQDKPMKPGKKF